MELSGDVLRLSFDHSLFLLLDIVVVKARKDVLLMQLVKLCSLLGNFFQKLCYFVLDVDPARGQEVHFDYSIAIIVKGTGRHQPPALVRVCARTREAICSKGAWQRPSGRMGGIRLSVRDVAADIVRSINPVGASTATDEMTTHRFVRSLHMAGGSQRTESLCLAASVQS